MSILPIGFSGFWTAPGLAPLPCKVVEHVLDNANVLGYRVEIEGLTQAHLKRGYTNNEFVPRHSKKLSEIEDALVALEEKLSKIGEALAALEGEK